MVEKYVGCLMIIRATTIAYKFLWFGFKEDAMGEIVETGIPKI
jgi:hypothetical protein